MTTHERWTRRRNGRIEIAIVQTEDDGTVHMTPELVAEILTELGFSQEAPA